MTRGRRYHPPAVHNALPPWGKADPRPMPRRPTRLLLASALSALLVSMLPAWAADAPLVEAARKEGRVVWLTTQIMGELALPLASAFKSAYGIDVSVVRTPPRHTADRLVQAARSPQTGIDVVDGRSAIPHLKRAGLLAPLDVAAARRLPAELVDREGFWVATNVFVNAIVVNTERVAPDRRPRTLEDLTRAEWAGRMTWSGQPALSGGAGFVGSVLRDRGETDGRALLERLGRQQIVSFDVPSRQIIDKVISGTFELGLQVFNTQVAVSAAGGAPVAWLPIEPLTGSVAAVALTRQAPHPNAARLLVEFLLSRQAQEIFRDADTLPASPEVAPKEPAMRPSGASPRTVYFTPEEIEARLPDWQALRNELFR
jgi:ABC-type Fe3+ transport system substrate-binding protein